MNKNEPIKIGIILGSTRQGRFGEHPAQWIESKANETEGIEAELLDLRDFPLPFFDEPVSPAMTTQAYDNEVVQKWSAKITEKDAFIIATPEYNHGYPAVLKNALDYVWHPWNDKPVAFVSWGSVSGSRAVEQLRLVSVELRMLPIRSAVHIASPWELKDENGNVRHGAFEPYEKGLQSMLADLKRIGNALKMMRQKG